MMKRILTLGMVAALLLGCMSVSLAEETKPVILVVSFGTSYNDSRDITIGAIEEEIQSAYPDYEVRRAFTAQTIIDKLLARDNLTIDNVIEAMDRLVADGVKKVIIQPTHIMNGYEYDDLIVEVLPYAAKFDSFAVGEPLLTSQEDYEAVAQALLAQNEYITEEKTAVVFMGHGTEHYANATYSELENMIHMSGYENVFIGTVEGYPGIDVVEAKLAAYGAEKVILYPMMVVAGDHANNDMAGDEDDSWKVILTEAGYEVDCKIQGIAQTKAIREHYVEHVQAAIDSGSYVTPDPIVLEKGACDIEKKAIVVVSFGTSYSDSLSQTIEAIENDVKAAYAQWDIYRAFTAQTIIDKLAERDGVQIDNVQQVLERLIADGYGTVVIQSTHVMNGYEYDDVVREANLYADYFASFSIGTPLLTSEADYEEVIASILADSEDAGSEDVALVYMGHGSEHFANATYSQLQNMMHSEGYVNAFVGTVEGFPMIEQMLAQVSAYGAKKVILTPMMVVAGDHANNDMAGDEEDSWKTAFETAGFEVECNLEGLGQNEAIRQIYLKHLATAISSVSR